MQNPSPTDHQPDVAWVFDFILVSAIWGVSFLFQHLALPAFGPLAMSFVRVASAALFLLPILFYKGLLPAFKTHALPIMIVGITNSAIPFLCYAYALQTLSTGLTGILNATVPLFGSIIAWAWLGDKLNASRIVGLLIGFGGIVMLTTNKASFSLGGSGWGILACLTATLLYGFSASYSKKYLSGVPAIAIATGSMVSATLLLLIPGVWAWPSTQPDWQAWSAALTVGVVCSGVAYIIFYRLINKIGPARTIPVTFLIPIFALVAGAVFLGEQITPAIVIWGSVILIGTSLSTGLWSLSRVWESVKRITKRSRK